MNEEKTTITIPEVHKEEMSHIQINPEHEQVFYTQYMGGVFVSFKTNITLMSWQPITERQPEWKENLVNLLHSRGYSASIKNNDVVINENEKVLGMVKTTYYNGLSDVPEGMANYVAGISFNIERDAIIKWCFKRTEKVPMGLSDYGITQEEVLEALNITIN